MLETHFLVIGIAATLLWLAAFRKLFTASRLRACAALWDLYGGRAYRWMLATADHLERMQRAREESRRALRREMEVAR